MQFAWRHALLLVWSCVHKQASHPLQTRRTEVTGLDMIHALQYSCTTTFVFGSPACRQCSVCFIANVTRAGRHKHLHACVWPTKVHHCVVQSFILICTCHCKKGSAKVKLKSAIHGSFKLCKVFSLVLFFNTCIVIFWLHVDIRNNN